MENVYQFILDLFVGNGLVIAVAAFVVGTIIKQSVKFIPNDLIPLIGGVLGIILGIAIPDIFPGTDLIVAAIDGLALGWAATGGYETIKNIHKMREN